MNTTITFSVYKQPNPNIHHFYSVYMKRNYSAPYKFRFDWIIRNRFTPSDRFKWFWRNLIENISDRFMTDSKKNSKFYCKTFLIDSWQIKKIWGNSYWLTFLMDSWQIQKFWAKSYCKTFLIVSWHIQKYLGKIVLHNIPDRFMTD